MIHPPCGKICADCNLPARNPKFKIDDRILWASPSGKNFKGKITKIRYCEVLKSNSYHVNFDDGSNVGFASEDYNSSLKLIGKDPKLSEFFSS